MKYFISTINSKNIVSINMIVKVGNDHETKNELEYAHFLEHLFSFFTSKKYPKYNEVQSILKNLGISFSAETHDYYTKYIFSTHKNYLQKLLDILFHTINDFQIDKTIYEQERNSVVIELKNMIEDPNYLLDTKINSILYPNHSRSVLLETRIKKINKTSINSILKFYKKHYTKSNIFFLFCGDIEYSTIKKYFSKNSLYKNNIIQPNFNINLDTKIIKVPKKEDKAYIKVVYKIPINYFDTQNYTLEILLDILTDDLDSILYKKLRSELGLIYYVESDNLIDIDSTMGYISINTSTNDNKRHILKIITTILDSIENIHKENISEYLEKYRKNNKMTIIKEKNCKDGEKMLNFYDNYFLFNKKTIDFYDYLKQYNKITANDIINFSKKFLINKNMFIVYSSNNNMNKQINNYIT